MTTNILFAAHPDNWEQYKTPLNAALRDAGINASLALDIAPGEVDYIIYGPKSAVQDFTPYTRAKAVMNLWAGVERVTRNTTLNIPLTRMVDPGLTHGMVEWVTGHVLRHHLGMDADILRNAPEWKPRTVPLARERRVTVLGLGELGRAVCDTLSMLGFQVTGWSRGQKDIPGIRCLSAAAGLEAALTDAEIVILLLPDTPATQDVLNPRTLALLAPGAFILNPGRGPLIDDAALLAALDGGRVAHATLDVFRREPLPKDHPYWTHPRVTVTPHIAADTRPETASRLIAENVRRSEAGEVLLHQVNRKAGY